MPTGSGDRSLSAECHSLLIGVLKLDCRILHRFKWIRVANVGFVVRLHRQHMEN